MTEAPAECQSGSLAVGADTLSPESDGNGRSLPPPDAVREQGRRQAPVRDIVQLVGGEGGLSRAYLKIGYFVRPIAVATRLGLMLQPRQRAIKWVARALFLVLRVADASPSWPVSSLIKLLVQLLLHLVSKSRPDADAEFALAILKELRLDIQCQRGASVKIGWKYLDD